MGVRSEGSRVGVESEGQEWGSEWGWRVGMESGGGEWGGEWGC